MRTNIPAGIWLALTSPIASLTFRSETIEVDFDDLKPSRTAFELTELRQYSKLKWDGFSVDSPQPKNEDGFMGVEVKSAPNFAGGRVDLFGGLPTLSTNYPSSQVAFFDLERFWWGCCTRNPDTGRLGPGWCTLEIYGYSPGYKEPTAKATSFFFPNDDAKSMEMVEAFLPPTFKAVSRVEFNVIASKPTLFVDNVKYTIYNVTSMGHGLREVIHSQETSQSDYLGSSLAAEIPLRPWRA